MRPQEINSREICLHLIFSAKWNKRDKFLHGHPACQKPLHSLQDKDWNIWALVSANIYPIDWKGKTQQCNGASRCFHSGEGLRTNVQPAINENTEHWVSFKKSTLWRKEITYFPQWMTSFYSFFCSFYLFKKLETIISLTVNPLLSPAGGLIYFKSIWEGAL